MNQCHCYLILIFSYESFILLLMEAWVGLLDVTESVALVLVRVLTVETFVRLSTSVDVRVIS